MPRIEVADEDRLAELARLKFRAGSVRHRLHTAIGRSARFPHGGPRRQADALAAELEEIRKVIGALSVASVDGAREIHQPPRQR